MLFFILSFLFLSPLPFAHSLNQEGLILHQVKLSLSDPSFSLSSWKPNDATPCQWRGVTCDPITQSVTSLDLSNTNVGGPFPTSLCSLKNLSFISFFNDTISSTLPLEISTCQNLQHLDLSENLLTGALPHTLAYLPNLKYLDLTGNNFSGDIPETFGSFPKLEVLSLVYNLLDGIVPPFLGNISSLKMLNLSYNPFLPGPVPPELGNLTNLEILWLTDCNLVGEIPESLGQLKKLTDLDLALNNLVGRIPSSLTGLTSVVQIELYNNSLTGELPVGWSNLKALRLLDASMNQLIGKIPDELCSLPLESLNLYENKFEGMLPESIANSPNLYELRLFHNRLTGELPKNLGKNSPLMWLDLSSNHFSGAIPATLCKNRKLEELLMIHNSFSGSLPQDLGECRSLTRVRLGHNRFSGEVPVGFWGLPHVNLLELTGNSFSGRIAKTIAGATNLSALIISNNKFSGEIPEEIGWLDNLAVFLGGDNIFSGPLPLRVAKLGQLERLDLHNNRLSGELSTRLKSLKKLNELNLGNNEFSGQIPGEIGSMVSLDYLDLSRNRFSGEIPLQLQNLKTDHLDLSYNRLSGDIPPLFTTDVYKHSFLGNPGLCGNSKGFCYGRGAKTQHYLWLTRLIYVLTILILVFGVIWFYFKYRNFRKARATECSKWTLMSFHKLGFNECEILDNLDEDNVIGTGSSGKVYKVKLSNGEVVAVKKLWNTAKTKWHNGDIEKGQDRVRDDGFEAEIRTLGKIRHKNIVKLWCSCTNRDRKLLVYEYMPNGSLADLLHSRKGCSLLDWPMRYKIAIEAAEGLSYLHHDCVPAIVHRDVKSNNILLDGDFGARVADFGLAKIVDASAKGSKSMSVIAGSCGYIAPEYAYTLHVNEKSDIYSFGVVILELVTGRQPVDPELGEKDLVKWVCTIIDQKGIDHVIDPKIDSCFKEEIYKVLDIGLLCTHPLPVNRPSMRRVVKMLQEVRAENPSGASKKTED